MAERIEANAAASRKHFTRRQVLAAGAAMPALAAIPATAVAADEDPVLRIYRDEYLPARYVEKAADERLEAIINELGIDVLAPRVQADFLGGVCIVDSPAKIDSYILAVLQDATRPRRHETPEKVLWRVEVVRKEAEAFRRQATALYEKAKAECDAKLQAAGYNAAEEAGAAASAKVEAAVARILETEATTPAGAAVKLYLALERTPVEDDESEKRLESLVNELAAIAGPSFEAAGIDMEAPLC